MSRYSAPRLSIRTALITLLATILVASGFLVYLTFGAISKSDRTNEQVADAANRAVLLDDIRAAYLSAWTSILSTGGPLDNRFIERFEQARASVDSAIAQLLKDAPAQGPDEQARVAALVSAHERVSRSWTPILTMLVDGRQTEARTALIRDVLPDSDALIDALTTEVQHHRLELDQALAASQQSRKQWERVAVLMGVAWVGVIVAGSFLAARWLLKPLRELAHATRLIAAGEVTALAPISGPAEVARLASDVNMMAVSLLHRSDELNRYLSKNLEARASELEAVVEALRASEAHLTTVIESAPLILFAVNHDGVFTLSKGEGLRKFGLEPGSLDGLRVDDVLSANENFHAEFKRALAGESFTSELLVNDVIFETRFTSLRDVNGETRGVIGVAMDISERSRFEEALRQRNLDLEVLNQRLATAHADLEQSKQEVEEKSRQLEDALEIERVQSRTDALTGALNHGAIVEELRQLVAAPETGPATVVMVDIDGMKAANDMYGHQFGDQLLTSVKEALSRNGALVGRYGGDEFVALLRGAARPEADQYREAVQEAVGHASLKDPEGGGQVAIMVSIGLSVYPDDGSRLEELIAVADADMYANKRRQPVTALEAAARRMGGDRAVWMVGEIVPVLTAAGNPLERVAFVCERLAVDCGYDAVEITMNPWLAAGRELLVAYPPIPEKLKAMWLRARREYASDHPLAEALQRTQRPVIIDRPQEDQRLAIFQRDVIRRTGLRSLMIAPLFWEGTLIGSLTVASRSEHAFGAGDSQFLLGISSQVSAILSMAMLLYDYRDRATSLKRAHKDAVRLFTWTVEAQAGVPNHDFDRLRATAEGLARRLGYGPDESEEIGLATTLHDIGKYRVPPHILARPNDLTEDEWEIVKRHTVWGARLFAGHASFELAGQIARWHHERWDGRGYPDGLAGDEIPLPVAIASVADSLDAMVFDRIYRRGIDFEAAIKEVIAGSGAQFNPRVVDALLRMFGEGRLPFAPSDGRRAAA